MGLHILNLNENKIAVSKKVQEEMTRLRENALLNSHIPFLYKDTSGTFKKLVQNVRSLHLHFPDVASDYNVKAADVKCNYNAVEININQPVPNLHVVGIYRSKSKVKTSRFIDALRNLHSNFLNDPNVLVILGDFNINLMENTSEKKNLRYLIEEKQYVQCINQFTTDYKTQIDHIYTNIPDRVKNIGVLETYFSDHKPIFVSLNS